MTDWCDSAAITKNQEKRGVAVFISQKENAKRIWVPPKYHERTWSDVVIYQDLEKDAAHCMRSYIPGLHEDLIAEAVEYLKYLRDEVGYRNFYQAVRYAGLFGKYDQNNCAATCLICKQELYASDEIRGDLPISWPYVDTTGSLNNPVISYILCAKCYLEREKIVSNRNESIRQSD